MKHSFYLLLILSVFVLAACKGGSKSVAASAKKEYPMLDEQTFLITKAAEDPNYGHSSENPIKVGGTEQHSGPAAERYYLNALLGPKGEKVTFKRTGSCCEFKTDNGYEGMGLLDQYEVSWEGLREPKLLFLNMYDFGELMIPEGFTAKKDH